MPATKIVNHHVAGHAQDLLTLASTTYKNILKGSNPSHMDTEKLLRYVNALRKELGYDVGASDPFLVEEPKSDVAKLLTVQVPAMEKPSPVPEKQKSGFLGR